MITIISSQVALAHATSRWFYAPYPGWGSSTWGVAFTLFADMGDLTGLGHMGIWVCWLGNAGASVECDGRAPSLAEGMQSVILYSNQWASFGTTIKLKGHLNAHGDPPNNWADASLEIHILIYKGILRYGMYTWQLLQDTMVHKYDPPEMWTDEEIPYSTQWMAPSYGRYAMGVRVVGWAAAWGNQGSAEVFLGGGAENGYIKILNMLIVY